MMMMQGHGDLSRAARTTAAAALILLAAAAGGCGQRNRGYLPPSSAAAPDRAEMLNQALKLAREAQHAEQEGREDRAIELYQQSVRTFPELGPAWHNLGYLLMVRGNQADSQTTLLEAAGALRTAADLMPSDPRPTYNLGVIWERTGWSEKAYELYEETLGRDESYLPALRRSIHLAQLMDKSSETVLDRIRRALLLEHDEQYREYFLRQEARVAHALRTKGSFAG